jgi:fatty-acid desaturase
MLKGRSVSPCLWLIFALSELIISLFHGFAWFGWQKHEFIEITLLIYSVLCKIGFLRIS